MKKSLLLIKYILPVLIWLGSFPIPVFSQNGWNLNWLKSISMRGNDDPLKIKTDSSKNIYLSATSGSAGTLIDSVDLDHGVGSYWVKSNFNYFVKYDSSGAFLWAWSCKRLNNGGSEIRFDVSESGDVFLAFSFADSLDIDPGISTNYIYTSTTFRRDVAVLKFNSNGILQWVETFGGSWEDFVNSIAFDGDQSIYLVGTFGNTVDFDPGIGTFNVTSLSGNSSDVYLLRLSTSGSFIWVRSFGSFNSDDYADFVKIYNHSIITLCGNFKNTCDFDAGPDTFNLTAVNTTYGDAFLCQYDSAGSFRWAKHYGATNTNANIGSFAQDIAGNIYADWIKYLTPSTYTRVNTKFSLNGDSILSCDLSYANDAVSDGKDGIYFSWSLFGTYDFDPGAGVFNLSSTNNAPVIVKLDTSYIFIYAKIIAENGSSRIEDLSILADDGVYCVGTYSDTTDFNTYGGVTNAFPATNGYDLFLVKLTRPCQSPTQISDTLLACDSILVYGLNVLSDTSFIQVLPSIENCDSIINVNVELENTFAPSICLVSVDSTSSHNVIVFEKPVGLTSVDSFYIYRETGTSTYQIVGVLSDTSLSIFEDFAANPNSTSFKYKIASLNTCGEVSVQSGYHSTMHLQHLGNGNFQWTSYQIENVSNPVLSYNIFRDNLSTGNFQLIQVIPGNNTTFTDINFASYPNASYRIEVNWFSPVSCNPTSRTTLSYSTSRSNILSFGTAGLLERSQYKMSVSPNPVVESLVIDLTPNYESLNGCEFIILNNLGQPVYSEKIEQQQYKIERVSIGGSGLYYVCIVNQYGMIVSREKVVMQ